MLVCLGKSVLVWVIDWIVKVKSVVVLFFMERLFMNVLEKLYWFNDFGLGFVRKGCLRVWDRWLMLMLLWFDRVFLLL